MKLRECSARTINCPLYHAVFANVFLSSVKDGLVRLIPQNSRALPAAFLQGRPILSFKFPLRGLILVRLASKPF
jgi:hypothetical protein